MISDNKFAISLVQTQLYPIEGKTLNPVSDAKKIFVDGSGDGHICIIFEIENSPIIERHPVKTNNDSEWQALYSAMTHIKSYDQYVIYSDSRLIINQFHGKFKATNPRMRKWKQMCRRYLSSHGLDVKVTWIPRHKNPAGKYLEQYFEQKNGEKGNYIHW
jgi:ribonuclease HI